MRREAFQFGRAEQKERFDVERFELFGDCKIVGKVPAFVAAAAAGGQDNNESVTVQAGLLNYLRADLSVRLRRLNQDSRLERVRGRFDVQAAIIAQVFYVAGGYVVVSVRLPAVRQEDNFSALAAVRGENKVLLEGALGFSKETYYPGISCEGIDEAIAAGGLKVERVTKKSVHIKGIEGADFVNTSSCGEIAYVVAAAYHIYYAKLEGVFHKPGKGQCEYAISNGAGLNYHGASGPFEGLFTVVGKQIEDTCRRAHSLMYSGLDSLCPEAGPDVVRGVFV